MITIPRHIEPVRQEDMDRLLERQWRARVALRQNPFAFAMNCKWQRFYRQSAKVLAL